MGFLHDAAADAVVRSTTEPDEYAAALAGGEFEFVPLPGTRFAARHRLLRVSDMLVQQADCTQHTMRGALHAGLSALLVPLHYTAGPARMNGSEVNAGGAFLLTGGVEFRATSTSPVSWAALAVQTDRLETWLELAEPAICTAGQAAVLGLPEAANAHLLRILSVAARLAEDPPEALRDPACCESLGQSLADAMLDAMTTGAVLLPQPRAAAEAHRVVRMAEDYLQSHIERPVYREQLCAALGISLRKLHDAFVAVTGAGPQVYLKLRRLLLVRRTLRAAADRPALVKSVALSHGFWHLGHFARDYRRLFGESPSLTLTAEPRRGVREHEAVRKVA